MRAYILDSLVETTLSRDILLMTRVDKPALLRQLFYLACEYSGQILSYTKMLGQLADAGNTTTLAHYLRLLAGAGLVIGLPKYSGGALRRRASSPKLQVMNTALMTALKGRTLKEARSDAPFWGLLVESAVGAQLLADAQWGRFTIDYWRDGNDEVDFVAVRGDDVTVIEVKSGPERHPLAGLEEFRRSFKESRVLLVGEGGVDLERFFLGEMDIWDGGPQLSDSEPGVTTIHDATMI
ncbi:MAG: ATP-binding protein [Thermoleophilia bacterium]